MAGIDYDDFLRNGDVELYAKRQELGNTFGDVALSYTLQQVYEIQNVQFNIFYELLNPHEIATPELILAIKEQVVRQLMEHSLAQPFMDKHQIEPDDDGFLHYPFQKTHFSFVDEVIRSDRRESIFRKLEPYFLNRFGRVIGIPELTSIRDNPKALRSLASDKLYYRTALGLELSELIGLVQVERKLKDLKPGQMVVEVSPAEPGLRKTEVLQNWFRAYEKKDDESVSAYYIKTFDDFKTVLKHYSRLGSQPLKTVFVQDLVANPVIFNGSLDMLLARIGFRTDPGYLATYGKVMRDARVIQAVENFVNRVVSKTVPVENLEIERKRLEKLVVAIHKEIVAWYLFTHTGELTLEMVNQIALYQQFYGMGGGCGPEAELIALMGGTGEDEFGSLTFECPSPTCRQMNIRTPGLLLPHCQHCGAEIPKC